MSDVSQAKVILAAVNFVDEAEKLGLQSKIENDEARIYFYLLRGAVMEYRQAMRDMEKGRAIL